uniref:Uncharacterized protein n=1 Tax=Glossina austeni TaxID=7395 RepID=A0A1A9UCT7_GLOAU
MDVNVFKVIMQTRNGFKEVKLIMNDCLKKQVMIEDNFSKCKYLEQPELLPHNGRGSPASAIVSVDLTTEKLSTDCGGKASVKASIGTAVYPVPNLKLNNNLNMNNKLNNIPEVVVNSPSSDVYRTHLDVPISIFPLPLVPVAQSIVRIVDSSGAEGTDGLCNHDSVELVAIPAQYSDVDGSLDSIYNILLHAITKSVPTLSDSYSSIYPI